MQLVLMRAECRDGRTCPNVNLSDHGTYVVQGYIVSPGHLLPASEAVVEIPLSLLPELVEADPRDGLSLTDRGTILVRGTQITDAEALAELDLPAGENAVEVPLSVLGELETAHVG